MNNTKHVTSLEVSKKLKDLGVKQDSFFYWHDGKLTWVGKVISWGYQESFEPNKKSISAFLVSELGEMLPSEQEIFDIAAEDREWWALYCQDSWYHNPDILGKMLYLIQNNLLKARAQ